MLFSLTGNSWVLILVQEATDRELDRGHDKSKLKKLHQALRDYNNLKFDQKTEVKSKMYFN